MLDMSAWPQKRFDVTKQLRLDPQNVRLGLSHDAPQGDIIQDLFQNEGAFQIAEAVTTIGFFTHDLPIVVKEGRYWTVVEGNRRTAAIKALLNPYVVPGFQTRLAKLVQGIPTISSLQTINAVVAPDRNSANQVIAALHTSNPRKPWAPLRQADFFYAQIIAGKTVQKLQEEYPGTNVAEFIKMAEMHKLLRTVDYTDPNLSSYASRRNFPISTFDRLYANDQFLSLAKLEVDPPTGHFTLAGDKEDFARLAQKLVADIKAKRIDTRVLNKPESESYKTYFEELRPFEVKSATERDRVPVIEATVVEPPTPKRGSRLVITGLQGIPGYPSTERILDELGRINYHEFPNATFDLIRTFLEKSIKARAGRDGKAISGRRAGAFVSLDDALSWLLTEVDAAGQRSLRQPINLLTSRRNFTNFPGTKEFLDAANHNHQIFITPEEVKDLWDSNINIFKFILGV